MIAARGLKVGDWVTVYGDGDAPRRIVEVGRLDVLLDNGDIKNFSSLRKLTKPALRRIAAAHRERASRLLAEAEAIEQSLVEKLR